MKRLLLALFFSVVAQGAFAQQLEQEQLSGLIVSEVKEQRMVLIVGDQLAGGMGAGLARMAFGQPEIKIVNRFNELSGLARPQIYNWAGAIPKIAEGKSFSNAIVWLGLNDRRDLRVDGNLISFGSPEWAAIYIERIDGLIDALAAQKMRVVWLGLPPVSDPVMDGDLQKISTLFSLRAAAKGVEYVDLRKVFLDPTGSYTERGPDDTGVDARLRERDGVSFMKLGNNRLGQIVLGVLNATKAGPVVAAVPETPVVAQKQLDQLNAAGPIFGKAGDDNVESAQVSLEVAAGVAVDVAAEQAASTSIIGIGAVKGSAADALFTTGLSKPAPPGRFDDFSLPPSN